MKTITPRIPPNQALTAAIAPRRIEMLAFPDVQILDVAGPTQVFTAANELAQAQGKTLPYEVQVVSPQHAQVKATSGLSFMTTPMAIDGPAPDTLIIPGGRGVMLAAQDAALGLWLHARAAQARRVASVCTGAFLLASTGLLDGRRAVTHWRHCRQLADQYPQVVVETTPIFVHDGAVWTSAGVTAGIDLSLALVEADLGHDVALEVARSLVVFLKRPGDQSQFSSMLALQSANTHFASLHDWILRHLAEDLSLARLAHQAGMSERTFLRRYREATGQTPARAVEGLRIESARQLLVQTRLPIKRIVASCGFGAEETMRRSFQRQHGISPSDYRARFGEQRQTRTPGKSLS